MQYLLVVRNVLADQAAKLEIIIFNVSTTDILHSFCICSAHTTYLLHTVFKTFDPFFPHLHIQLCIHILAYTKNAFLQHKKWQTSDICKNAQSHIASSVLSS